MKMLFLDVFDKLNDVSCVSYWRNERNVGEGTAASDGIEQAKI